MAKTTKPSAKSSSAPAPASKKAASKRTKATKTVSSSKPTAQPVPEPVSESVSAPVTETVASTDSSSDNKSAVPGLQSEFTNYLAKIQQAVSILSTLRTEFRALERKALRELKVSEKASSRRRRRAGTRAPSGFVKPTLISDELASFLGKDSGTEMARTEVTREINAYIRENKLQDKDNGRKINADAKLSVLLSLKAEDELTYFNLQRYMSRHFAKAGKPVEASS